MKFNLSFMVLPVAVLALQASAGQSSGESVSSARDGNSSTQMQPLSGNVAMYERLFEAAEGGNSTEVQELLRLGIPVDSVRRSGSTVLMLASLGGHAEVVRLLLSAGADVNEKGDDKKTALMAAAGMGHADVVRILLDTGADVNAAEEKGWTALIFAARKAHTDIVRTLLIAGAEINAKAVKGVTALVFAAYDGHVDIVRTLLVAGADDHPFSVRTALKLAAQNGDDVTMKILLSSGFSVDAKGSTGMTTLMHAASHGHVTCIRILLNAGANVNAIDRQGNTPLMHAATHGHTAVVRELLSQGANRNFRNENGETAEIISTKRGHGAVSSLLGFREHRLGHLLKQYDRAISVRDEIKLQCGEAEKLARSNIARSVERFASLNRRLSMEERSVTVAQSRALGMVREHDIELTDKVLEPLLSNDVHEKFRNELLLSARNHRQPLAMQRFLSETLGDGTHDQREVVRIVCEFALSELQQKRLREVLQAERKRAFNNSHESSRPSKRQRTH